MSEWQAIEDLDYSSRGNQLQKRMQDQLMIVNNWVQSQRKEYAKKWGVPFEQVDYKIIMPSLGSQNNISFEFFPVMDNTYTRP